jgi:hypothetical protein
LIGHSISPNGKEFRKSAVCKQPRLNLPHDNAKTHVLVRAWQPIRNE